MTLKLGKQEARPDAVTFRFSDFVNLAELPAPPANFGNEGVVPVWGMDGNDVAGDCVFAGTKHEIQLWTSEAKSAFSFHEGDTGTAIRNYSAFTGYDPSQTDDQGNNPTDQGTDVASWLSHRRTTGFIDDANIAHRIGAYVKLSLRNLDELRYAIYYFDGVGIGINFPEQWMETFQRGGRVWDRLSRPNYQGGHYITAVAWRNGAPVIVTWGQKVTLTPAAYSEVADEVYAYLTPEKIVNGVDGKGIAYAKLASYLKGLKGIH